MLPSKLQRNIDRLIPASKKYVFDDEASIFLGKFIRDCGDIILEQRQFALPPFKTTYLEFNIDLTLKTVGRTVSGSSISDGDKDTMVDTKIGYLIHGNVVSVLVEENKTTSRLMPIQYLINQDQYDNTFHFKRTREDENWVRMGLFCGSTVHDLPDEGTRQEILRENNFRKLIDISQKDLEMVYYGSFGDLRNVWAMLLLLNQPAKVGFTREKPTRRMVGNKLTTFSAYNVVNINIGKRVKNIRNQFHFEKRATARHHEVRGHFAHYNVDENCAHAWGILPDQERKWTCSKCGGKRIWRESYERGDKTRGVIIKDHYKANV